MATVWLEFEPSTAKKHRSPRLLPVSVTLSALIGARLPSPFLKYSLSRNGFNYTETGFHKVVLHV